jgi:hypothetical protein
VVWVVEEKMEILRNKTMVEVRIDFLMESSSIGVSNIPFS